MVSKTKQKARELMVPIPREKLEEMKGKGVHIGWAWAGCVWILREIDHEKGRIRVETPKSHKMRWEDMDEAYYTRKHEPQDHPKSKGA
jgi:hypothetical protein